MAKECVNCKQRIGFMTGEHFDGLLCDSCYNEFGGMSLIKLESESDPDKYIECYTKIASEIDNKANPNVDREKIKYEFHKRIESRFKLITKCGIQEYLQNKIDAKEKEIKHVSYARSFNEFYEYDVVTIINEDHGTIDKERMMNILSEHTKNGWRLHTIYSNELGKNAIRILGLGINSTACEDVLIFERRIPEFDS